MKKIIALLLAFTCLFSLTSCGMSEEDARKPVDGFIEAFSALDTEKMETFVDDPAKIPDALRKLDNLKTAKTEAMQTLPEIFAGYEIEMGNLIDKLIDRVVKSMKLEVTKAESSADGYIFTVKSHILDENFDLGNALGTIFAEKLSEETINGILAKLMEEQKITSGSSQETMMKYLMPEIFLLLEEAVDEVEIKTTAAEKKYYVHETEDGKILINAEKTFG